MLQFLFNFIGKWMGMAFSNTSSAALYDSIAAVFLVSCLFCWIMSLITGDFSQVDRLWSILPALYSCIVTYHAIIEKGVEKSTVMIVMSLVTILWGSRLTLQFVMKGGYTHSGEDYRWAYVRECFGNRKFALHAFNLFFIVIYQNILLLLLVFPQVAMVPHQTKFEGLSDIFITILFIFLFIVEVAADLQQQYFQVRKHKAIAEGSERKGDYKAGFLRTGLFAYCRHPNYLCEVLLWWVFAMFSLSRCGFNWTFIGAANLTGLFTGSVDLTEQISASKYAEYKEYQKHVPSVIPPIRMMTIKPRARR